MCPGILNRNKGDTGRPAKIYSSSQAIKCTLSIGMVSSKIMFYILWRINEKRQVYRMTDICTQIARMLHIHKKTCSSDFSQHGEQEDNSHEIMTNSQQLLQQNQFLRTNLREMGIPTHACGLLSHIKLISLAKKNTKWKLSSCAI